MQSRRQTLIEVGANLAIGSVGAWLITYAAIKWLQGDAAVATWSLIGCTIWSFIRQYLIRRYFNKLWSKTAS